MSVKHAHVANSSGLFIVNALVGEGGGGGFDKKKIDLEANENGFCESVIFTKLLSTDVVKSQYTIKVHVTVQLITMNVHLLCYSWRYGESGHYYPSEPVSLPGQL